jgi:hypothetical protein
MEVRNLGHFSEQTWADYVRGVGQPKMSQEVETHLASNCADCTHSYGIWKKVSSIATAESSLTPPDHAVRTGKLQSATRQFPQTRPWIMAKLMFDSLNQPLTAGVRSGPSDSRNLMFNGEGTTVTLVLDTQSQPGTISLIGQVVDKSGAKIAPRQAEIILWTETFQPVAETSCNEFGEFQMEFKAQGRLRLTVEIAGKKSIRIPPLNLKNEVVGSVT